MHQCIHWRRNGSTRGLGSAQGEGTTNFWLHSFHAMLIGSVLKSRIQGGTVPPVPPPMTTSQADPTVCCSPGSPPEISENILVICVVALGGGAQSPLHRFSRDALLMAGGCAPVPLTLASGTTNVSKCQQYSLTLASMRQSCSRASFSCWWC